MRRSRRKGQLRRMSSSAFRSTSPTRISSRSCDAFGQHATEGIAEKRSAPEFEALARSRLAADVAGFKSDAVHHRDIDAVGDGMGALDGAPGVVLGHTELGLLRGMPADCGRIEQHCAPCKAVRRAPSGYHWSQQTSVPSRPALVSRARKPRSPGVK